jgi:hypothetical protein
MEDARPRAAVAIVSAMTHHQDQTDPYPGVRLMILGAIVAVLAPLGGFLAGSIVGSTREVASIDAQFAWMFAGLFVGGVGALVLCLGLLRWTRAVRQQPEVDRSTSRA